MKSNPEWVQDTRQELSRIKAASVWDLPHQPHPNLNAFLNAYYKYEGLKVLVWAGFLGSGKTRSRHLASDLRGYYYDHDQRLVKIGTRTWEYAEKIGRMAGHIETSHGVPMSEAELLTASYILEMQIYESMSQFRDTEVETPLLTSLRVEEGGDYVYKGRELGLRAIYNLVWRKDEFDKLEPYTVWVAGLSAGEYLRGVVPPFREAIHRSESLEEAQALAVLCALDPPHDKKVWEMMRLDGASFEESERVNVQFEEEVVPLYTTFRPEFVDFDRQYIETDMLGHIATSPSMLNLNEYRVFVGINDSRRVSPDRELLNRFVLSRGGLKLTDKQIRDLTSNL